MGIVKLYSVKEEFWGKEVIISTGSKGKAKFKRKTLRKDMTDHQIRNAVIEGVDPTYFEQSKEVEGSDALSTYALRHKDQLRTSVVKAKLDFGKVKITKQGSAPKPPKVLNDHYKYQNMLIRQLGVEKADELLAKAADAYTEDDVKVLKGLKGLHKYGKEKLYVFVHGEALESAEKK